MRRILPTIVFTQFAGTSLWFAGNAVLPELQRELKLEQDALSLITSSVQLGFIVGTLCFAILSLADRVSPRLLFMLCAVAGAAANTLLVFLPGDLTTILLLRVATGFLLAGVYPVGMKIAAGWYSGNLGKAIGFLVGALVLGTAFPHLLRAFGTGLHWQTMLLTISGLAAVGGITMYLLVPDGPYLRKGAAFDVRNMWQVFKVKEFRAAAFGYFGHMWELYTFWAFVPVILAYSLPHLTTIEISFYSFCIIAAGAVGCVGGGYLSQRYGSARVAFVQLLLSGLCCVATVFMLQVSSAIVVIPFLMFWGIVVAGDSPQFSALNARTAPQHLVGTALTVVVSIGFALTIVSIQFTAQILKVVPVPFAFALLVIGPVLGLISLRRLVGR